MADKPDLISADERQALAALAAEAALAQGAVQAFAKYLCQKYQIVPPDQLLASGKIYRPKPEAA